MSNLASLTRAALKAAVQFHAASLERVAAAAAKATDRALRHEQDMDDIVELAKRQLGEAQLSRITCAQREQAIRTAVTEELDKLPFLNRD